MSDKIDTALKTTDNVLAEILSKTVETLAKAQETYGAATVDLVLTIARVMAAQELLTGIITAIAAIVCSVLVVRSLRKMSSETRKLYRDRNEDIVIGNGMLTGLFGVGFITCSIAAVTILTKVYLWVGVFDPKIYIAYSVVSKLLK